MNSKRQMGAETDGQTADSNPQRPNKKPYHEPAIRVYGDVGAITKTIGSSSPKNDGGSGSTKTH
jgi:hypothetical protein